MTFTEEDERGMDELSARNGLKRLPGESIGDLWVRNLQHCEDRMLSSLPVSDRLRFMEQRK
jgi:hypothetical protein